VRVAVGCSYTAGTGVDGCEAYPTIMGYENWAKAGVDIEYTLWTAHRAVEHGATHLLFQLTSWDRSTLANEGTHNFAHNRSYTGVPKVEHYTVADYVNSRDDNFKWYYETQTQSNWRTENLSQRLVEFRTWAGWNDCEVKFFDWLPRHKGINVHPLVATLLPSQSVLDWLGDDYFVDDHYHVNAGGHLKIAREYLGT